MRAESCRELPKGGGDVFSHCETITREDLFCAWRTFQKGKMKKVDVLAFALCAEEHIHDLWADVRDEKYQHGFYTTFQIRDPKLRTISKASVRDRLLHQTIFTYLESSFERGFIYDSYASRRGKGMLAMLERFEDFAHRISCGNKKTVWVLKCDIRKFFDSVDHAVLQTRMCEKVTSPQVRDLVGEVVRSFSTRPGKGIPLGNITSQIFANVYLDILDQFVKRNLGVKYYMRYADDIVILSDSREMLVDYLQEIRVFLRERLHLELHPHKISIRSWRQGVDILGYISYPGYRMLRTKTKHRIRKHVWNKKQMLANGLISQEDYAQTAASYRGRIQHAWSEELEHWTGLEKE